MSRSGWPYANQHATASAVPLLPVQVMSGQLYAPGVPDTAELLEMRKLVDTYGKTWHTWQVDRGDTLPLGQPCCPPSCSSLASALSGCIHGVQGLPWSDGTLRRRSGNKGKHSVMPTRVAVLQGLRSS